MLSVTVTDQTMTVIADGEILAEDWANVIYGNGLQDRVMDVVDYRVEGYETDTPLHTWRIFFAAAATPARVR